MSHSPHAPLPSALENLDQIEHRLAGRTPALFLDYDGTLTPIVARPELATLSSLTRQLLDLLATHMPVAIVSGRDRADVESLVGLPQLAYVGSHGFDIACPNGVAKRRDLGEPFLPALDAAEADLRADLGDLPGVLIERKRFSIAVHYRAVGDRELSFVAQAVGAAATHQPDLKIASGKKVYDIRPAVDWHKGKAILDLFEALGLNVRSHMPIFIGDDETDEDGFREIKSCGIGILVTQDPRPSSAAFRLETVDEVFRFLGWLEQRIEAAAAIGEQQAPNRSDPHLAVTQARQGR